MIDPQRANGQSDGARWLAPYLRQAAVAHDVGAASGQPGVPGDFVPWWDSLVRQPLRRDAGNVAVTVDHLVTTALEHSPHVLAIDAASQVRRTQVVQQAAAFDLTTFWETRFIDSSEPVGNLLTTGGPPRFLDQHWTGAAGIRMRNTMGGEVELAQRYGWQETNSLFFVPRPQGTARLELNYSQPLLNGAGEAVNVSRVVLAELDAQLSLDDSAGRLQSHLLEVTETYWDLYLARAHALQRERLLHQAEAVRDALEAHPAADPLQRALLRARAAVAARQTEMIRAQAAIKNSETALRLLVNDPLLVSGPAVELVPGESPLGAPLPFTLADALHTALLNRPDISSSIRQIRTASVRLGVADNDLKPKLNMVLSTYLAGLEGNSSVSSAFANQFTEGRPSYAAGLLFEFPWGNRAARARHDQRVWEFNRALHEFRAVVGQGMTDVELALREVQTAQAEIDGAYAAMLATARETEKLETLWKDGQAGGGATAELLESLFWSQQRLADQELAFARAQVASAKAVARLKRSMGTLLMAARAPAGAAAASAAGGPRDDALPNRGWPAPASSERPTQPLAEPLPVNGIPRPPLAPRPERATTSARRSQRPLQHHVLNPRAAAASGATRPAPPGVAAQRGSAAPEPAAEQGARGNWAGAQARPAAASAAAQPTGWTIPIR